MAQRIFDVVIAALGLLSLLPLLLGIAVLIRLTSPGPILHRGARVGKDGKIFCMYKFRSMVVNAAQLGPGITATGDIHVTPVGRWLRQPKLDELPQLINVLRGDMSLVGPRPEDPRYVALYTPEQRRVLSVRPGITSAASVHYHREEAILQGPNWEEVYRTVVMPNKLRLDLDYLASRTFLSDMRILWETLRVLCR
ncbi:MAG TPA: sugar transferase [Candidatus Binatia bacterium]|nr:sugar transferase [Candidatus Binatia bacterium]